MIFQGVKTTLRSIKESVLKDFKIPVILEAFNLFRTKPLKKKSFENVLMTDRQETKLALELADFFMKNKSDFHLALKHITVAMI